MTDPLPLDPSVLLAALRRHTSAFETLLRTADLQAPVVWCGDWRLRDLGGHLGEVHRWATEVVRTGAPVRQEFGPGRGGPAAELADWYAESAAGLLDVLAATEPDRPCWHFLPAARAERAAAFWFRRQAQESAVHLADAQLAAAMPVSIEPVIAADGVDEVLRWMLPAVRRWYEPPPLERPLIMHATDTGHRWLVTPGADTPVATLAGPDAEAGTRVAAPAQELLLALWKRTDVTSSPPVAGDPAPARRFLSARMTP